MTVDFLQEVSKHSMFDNNHFIVKCHGISQDPEDKKYLMVMDYIPDGNLRKYLQNNYYRLTLVNKLDHLIDITAGLKSIHEQKLIHKDFHSGNILNETLLNNKVNINKCRSYVTDLGLCRPANKEKEGEAIYGIIFYLAPEVLQNHPYTPASDVYSFGIIAYELLANSYPYGDLKDLYPNLESEGERDNAFARDVICNGLRPDIDKVSIPQLLKDLIKSC